MTRRVAVSLCAVRRTLAVFGLAAAVALALPASLASAQEPDPAKTELAKRHFALGELYYNQGNYAKALAAFEESYALSQRDALLYNIGRCQEALGELAKALAAFERYADKTRDPDPNLKARIANLRARLATRPPLTATPASTPATVPAPADPAPSTPQSWMRPTAWVLVGVGAAALAAGAALGATARARADEVSEAYRAGNREWASVADTESSGKSLEKGAIASFVVGGVLAAGGVILHLVAPRRERRVVLAPILDGQSAGLAAGGRF
jgi:tetratricopeptide (TPR) repeat protein